jgi:hypothetical protein
MITTSDGERHVIEKLSMKNLLNFTRTDISFIKLIPENHGSNIVAETSLEISKHFNVPVRVVPTKESTIQVAFNVRPNDSLKQAQKKASFPERPYPEAQNMPLSLYDPI